MSTASGPLLVLGIGNVLLGDDGVGVHVIRELHATGTPFVVVEAKEPLAKEISQLYGCPVVVGHGGRNSRRAKNAQATEGNSLDSLVDSDKTRFDFVQPTPMTDAREIEGRIGHAVDLILDAGPLKGGVGSTVVDVTGETPIVIREGEVPRHEIVAALRSAG